MLENLCLHTSKCGWQQVQLALLSSRSWLNKLAPLAKLHRLQWRELCSAKNGEGVCRG
jgi:hypothetical protein